AACLFSTSRACFVNFFFQAEDGIRDFHVTGVQTCALPISDEADARLRANPAGLRDLKTVLEYRLQHTRTRPMSLLPELAGPLARSEERRVGKEPSSRWWLSHLKGNDSLR